MTAPNRQHGKTVGQWERICLTKTRYADEYSARAGAFHVLTTERFHMTVDRMFVYKCPNCRGWHMSKKTSAHPPVTRDSLLGEDVT